MPQVDLEALVSVYGASTGDRKIEPLVEEAPDNSDVSETTDLPPDFPPESFWLSGDAEFDWFDRNAFLERKESTRANANSTSSTANSQRFSKNLKQRAAIIGLPNTQKKSHVDNRRHINKPPVIRMFPSRRSNSVGKSMAPMTEPSSPNVSCIGRVRSKRGRRRKTAKPEKHTAKPTEGRNSDGGGKKKGFYSGLRSLFRSDRRCNAKEALKIDEPAVKSSSGRKTTTSEERDIPKSVKEAVEPAVWEV